MKPKLDWVHSKLLALQARRQAGFPESAVLMVVATVELILLRHAWRTFQPRIRYRELLVRAGASVTGAHLPLLKQTSLLAGLVGAYLQYYFVDVHLQIASLKSVTVFVPVSLAG